MFSFSLGRILSAGAHVSVTVKHMIVQFSFERPFEMFQCTKWVWFDNLCRNIPCTQLT